MSKVYHNLEGGDFFQDWSNRDLLRANNDWSRVASIMGYRGATLTNRANVDARTVLGNSDEVYAAVDRTGPNTYLTAGVAEFALDNPTVAIAGSSITRAPSLVLYMDATGRENVTLSFTARDLESGADDSKQQVVVQYRFGDTGSWANAPGGYIADATVANATKDTQLTVTLPDAVNGHADLQVRIMTVDTSTYDEWVGIDDIRVTSERDPGYQPGHTGIYDIQGAGHESPLEGRLVMTGGIVTAKDSKGFYLQDPNGDGNAATSDAIYVRNVPGVTVAVGDKLTVTGVVHEDVRGSGLTVTQIAGETLTITSRGNALPAALLVGAGGLAVPTSVIEDDGMTSFDPQHDGLDFWESLEGMRVTLDRPQAVSNTNSYGETYLVASRGATATGMNDRGGISFGNGDWNPELIQLDDTLARQPGLTIGDKLANLTGVIGYGYDHFEFLATRAATIAANVTLEREVSELSGDANHMTVATYNVANLDPSDARFARLAEDIVDNLHAPDVIALQRMQDADGTGTGTNLSGAATAQALIDAIFAESGIRYTYVEIAPGAANSTAGEENGNVRNGYLYRDDRVDLIEGSLHVIDDPVYSGTRSPLVATWEFNGEQVTTINVHFTTRFGSDELWGAVQNPYHAGTVMRTNQIAAMQRYLDGMLADDPDANVMIAGDWGGYLYERAQTQLTGTGLFSNLATGIDAAERYSTIVDGNAQLTDNIVISNGLAGRTGFDIVHINSEFAGTPRGSNHDPLVASIYIDRAPDGLVLNGGTVRENLPAGTVVGQLFANDTPGETLRYRLLDNAGGRFAVDATTGIVTAIAALDYEAARFHQITAQVTDSVGLSSTATLTVGVIDVNEAPVARADRANVNEDAQSANLWSHILANDSDPDAASRLKITAVNLSGTMGTVAFDPVTSSLRYTADADVFDALAPGQTMFDRFSYTVTDQHGLSHSATVEMVIKGVDDSLVLYGGNGKDTLIGGSGDDRLFGGNAMDELFGGAGHDWLQGDRGTDTLTGGSGRDSFAFGRAGGWDVVTDFNTAQDRVVLIEGVELKSISAVDYNRDGVADVKLTLTDGGNVILLGVSDPAKVDIDFASGPELPGGLFIGSGLDHLLPLDVTHQSLVIG